MSKLLQLVLSTLCVLWSHGGGEGGMVKIILFVSMSLS